MIKMLETRKGSEDGFTVKQFYIGKIYDIHETLARSFFAAGFAVKYEEENKKKSNVRKRFVKRRPSRSSTKKTLDI